MNAPRIYIENVKKRNVYKYYAGLVVRFLKFLKFASFRQIARFHGATVGKDVILPLSLARKANSNLIIGDDSSIEECELDLRSKIIIGKKCIINKNVQILRVSHFIDNNTQFSTRYYPPLIIEEYSWLCTGCHIMPSVTHISKGTVVSAFSTLIKNTSEMEVIGANGNAMRKHNSVYSDLVVCSLRGGDFRYYLASRFRCF